MDGHSEEIATRDSTPLFRSGPAPHGSADAPGGVEVEIQFCPGGPVWDGEDGPARYLWWLCARCLCELHRYPCGRRLAAAAAGVHPSPCMCPGMLHSGGGKGLRGG